MTGLEGILIVAGVIIVDGIMIAVIEIWMNL
jgi:hypothetical protein